MSSSLTLTHRGQTRTLHKHPVALASLKTAGITDAGQMREALRHAPWYLRLTINGRRRNFKLSADDKDALRQARDLLNGRAEQPADFAAYVALRDARRGVTIGVLAAAWIEAGLPFTTTKARSAKAAEQLRGAVTRALPWWQGKTVAGITPKTMSEYVVWRRQNVRRGVGDRSADLELSALSSLCQWAFFDGRIAANPFARRTRFQDSAAIKHCHDAMPENDDTLHRLLSWFWAAPEHPPRITAGAWLAFTALTGLRPQEPQALLRYPRLTAPPDSTRQLQPGQIFPTRDGSWRMKIVRYKRGQNPFSILTPIALEFLDAWNHWLPATTFLSPWFPNPAQPEIPLCVGGDTSLLNKLLAAACAECGLAKCAPKGFGRAYYVRVRRSQGADDATIAGELGQTTNGELIRRVYGEPDDMLAGGTYDWLPTGPPAWNLLKAAHSTSNIINL